MRLVTLRGGDRDALVIRPDDEISQAMDRMNETGRTLLLVVDGDRLVSVVADGDIRRHLAGGGAAEDDVAAAANRTPTTLPADTPPSKVREFMMRLGFEYLPLVDGDRIGALCILDRVPRPTDLSAVIMAGGLGSRLAPLTDDCPKPLLPLGGKPILSHILDHLREQGIHRYVFSVSYLAHMIVDHYDDGSGFDCFIDYVHESQRLGTGGPLSLIDSVMLSDPFLCVNGDVLNDVDVGALLETHVSNGWHATMVVRRHTNTIPYGVVETRDDGGFVQIHEKPVQSLLINAGVYMLSKSALDVVPTARFYDLPSLFEDLPLRGMPTGTFTHTGRWIDIGTRHEYDRAKAILDEEAGIP